MIRELREELSMLQPSDIPAALALLTRVPLEIDHEKAAADAARAAWAWPLVGAGIGALAAILGYLVWGLGAPGGVAAALALAFMALVTGALHEDGLADTADGLWGAGERAARLEIMKDARIGAFGLLALLLVVLGRWSGVEALFGSGGLFWALVVAGAVSRLPMAVALHVIPAARNDGMSARVGQVPRISVLVAGAICLVLALIGFGFAGIWVLIWSTIACLPVLALAWQKLGGQTGDVLGAAQQCAELGALASAVALLGAAAG